MVSTSQLLAMYVKHMHTFWDSPETASHIAIVCIVTLTLILLCTLGILAIIYCLLLFPILKYIIVLFFVLWFLYYAMYIPFRIVHVHVLDELDELEYQRMNKVNN